MLEITSRIANKIKELRQIDCDYKVFGAGDPAWGHFYQLNPVLSESALSKFEQENNLHLPLDYREFLKTIGNGRVGPFYGLLPLDVATLRCSPANPFLFPNSTAHLDDREVNEWEESAPGILRFCEQGCGYYSFLVVKGKNYGTVWNDHVAIDKTLRSTGQTFSEWYEAWLDRALAQLANLSLKNQLSCGLSRHEVIKIIGYPPFELWRREGMEGYGLLFENVPFDIRFGDDDFVCKVLDLPIA